MEKYQYFGYPLLIGLFLLACESRPPSTKVGAAELRTSEPSRLYFNNLRQNDYNQSESADRTHLLRLRNFPDSSLVPLVVPIIAHNWLEDEAYLSFQPVPYPGTYSDSLVIIFADSDTFQLKGATPMERFRAGEKLLNHLQNDSNWKIVTKAGSSVPLFEQGYGQDWTRTVLMDYFKLVDNK